MYHSLNFFTTAIDSYFKLYYTKEVDIKVGIIKKSREGDGVSILSELQKVKGLTKEQEEKVEEIGLKYYKIINELSEPGQDRRLKKVNQFLNGELYDGGWFFVEKSLIQDALDAKEQRRCHNGDNSSLGCKVELIITPSTLGKVVNR